MECFSDLSKEVHVSFANGRLGRVCNFVVIVVDPFGFVGRFSDMIHIVANIDTRPHVRDETL